MVAPFLQKYWLLILVIVILIFASVLYFIYRRKQQQKKRYQPKFPHTYLCLDGHRARSLSEVLIDNTLFRYGIAHVDEDLIVKKIDRKFKFDWYLPDCDIYLEFFGYKGKKYYETRKEKEKFYKQHRLNMIAIEPMDLAQIEDSIKEKLGRYWQQIIHSRHCPNCGGALDHRF